MKDRKFTATKDNKELEFIFKRPTQATINKGELVFRKVFSSSLREGILLHEEVVRLLKERGVWNDTHEELAKDYQEKISKLEEKLKGDELSDDEGRKTCEEIAELRDELINHNSVFLSVSDNTCESIASEMRNRFYASECVYDAKTNKRVYSSLEDFNSKRSEDYSFAAFREAIIASLETLVGQELPSDLSAQYAENKWLSDNKKEEQEEEQEKENQETDEVSEELKEENQEVE